MTDITPEEEIPPLSPAFLREHFPVAPSLRREHRAIFAPFLPHEQLKDDTAFYSALARMVACEEGIAALRAYDRRMRATRADERKAFATRAARWLLARRPELTEPGKARLDPEDLPPLSEERAVLELLVALTDRPAPGEAVVAAEGPPPGAGAADTAPDPDWRALAGRLAGAVAALEAPDPEAAGEILALAEALAEACRRTAEAEAARAALDQRMGALRDRLAAADPALAEAWPERVAAELLDALETGLAAFEAASAEVRTSEARQRALDDEARAAQAAGDLDAEEALIPRRRAARQAAAAAQAALDAARQALGTLLAGAQAASGPMGGADASGESADSADGTPVPQPGQAPDTPPGHFSAPSPLPEPGAGARGGPEGRPAEAPDMPGDGAPGAEAAAEPDLTPSPRPEAAPEPDAPAAPLRPDVSGPEPGSAPAFGADPEPAPRPAAGETDAASAPPPEPAPAPAPVGPLSDSSLLHWLQAGEIAFAYHAARLIEGQGARPVLPAAVLKGLALLRQIRRGEDMADPTRRAAMIGMMDALGDAEPRAAAVALAALLRPALFDPDHGARAHLRSLQGAEALAPEAAVIDALAGLGHEVRLSARALADLAGREVALAAPEAAADLRRWWEHAQRRKCMHQPTYRILHEELHPKGAIGRIIAAVVEEAPGAGELARSFVERLGGDRAAQEAFVEEAERRSGRPRRDRIEGMALTWFCERLQEACDHLSAWLAARAQDGAIPGDSQRARLQAALGPLRKALQQRLASKPPARSPGSGLDAALARLLWQEFAALWRLMAGEIPPGPLPSPEEALEGPLLRLPGGCQDWTEGDAALAAERAARDRRLAAALADPAQVAPDWTAALAARRAESAILPAGALLRRLEAEGLDAARVAAHRQALDEATAAARHAALERVERLRQAFATLANLDPEQAGANRDRLARLAAIAAALRADPEGDAVTLPAQDGRRDALVPPDFPELAATLAALEAERDRMRAAVLERQRKALAALCAGPGAEGARALLERLDTLDPVTVDDAIADLQAGRRVHLPEAAAPDLFEAFFPAFVRAVEQAGTGLGWGQIQKAFADCRDLGPLPLAALDEQTRRRGQRQLEAWSNAGAALRQSDAERLARVLEGLFGLIGFTGVAVRPGREAIPGRLRALTMQFDVPRVSDWFLPPAFGSETEGRIRLLVARDDVTIDQILREIGAEAPDAAWIVVQFRRLGEEERRSLARRCRDDARRMLLLDETLLLFLASCGEDPLRAVFACTLPFAWVQPYVTGAGPIPREVFFGREEEIRRIVAREAGGSLIYGGRQLGKSALLHHIRRERHRPDRGEIALYLDIKPLGGPGTPAERLWEELAHALSGEAGIRPAGDDPRQVIEAIRRWLAGGSERRMLLMLDEADNFLRAEHGRGNPNLLPLKALMEETGRRFKVVFAGLHNVRRMARAPNSPLPHLGDPICIGPMNQTEANRAALRRLAVEPLRSAGLDFAEPALAWDMLARMNHYPSLVQIFGHQVVERLGRGLDRRTGPRWRLGRETLFEGATAEAITKQIRNRFQLTLNLDLRYELFAKAIAYHRLETAGGQDRVLSQGLTAAEIRDLALPFWPQGLPQPSLSDCAEILSEMVDLGVLAELAPGRFGLRNAQVAQMLGDRDRLETELLELAEREDDPAYDAGSFHASLRPIRPADRAPLSDRQLAWLFAENGARLALVIAPEHITGPEAGPRLHVAAELFDLPAALVPAEDSALRRALEGEGIFVVEGAWSAERAQRLASLLAEGEGRARFLWLLPEDPPELPELPRVQARAWDENMLRLWLAEEGLAPALDDRETRGAILSATGGLPARVMQLRPELAELALRPVGERQARLAAWAREQPPLARAAGLSDADLAVLRFLAEHGADPDLRDAGDVAVLCPEADRARLGRLTAGGWLEAARAGSVPRVTPAGRLAAA